MSRSWLVIVLVLAAGVCASSLTLAQQRPVAVPECRWETDIGIPGAFSPFFTSLHEEEINAVLQELAKVAAATRGRESESWECDEELRRYPL